MLASQDFKAMFLYNLAVDGGWGLWEAWSACHKTCGGGVQLRHRRCTRPPPRYNGKKCVGGAEQSQSCNSFSCPSGLYACEPTLTL